MGSDYQQQFDMICDSYKEHFELAEEINLFAHSVLREISNGRVHNKDARELVTTTLFLRIMESYQGVLLLVKKGLIPPSKMILRCMIDQVSAIVLCETNGDFIEKYINSHEHDRFNAHKKMKEIGISTPYDIDEKINEIVQNIKDHSIPKLHSLDLLRDSGLFNTYISPYIMFSEAVHITPKDLEFYLTIDPGSDKIHSINYGPSDKDLNGIIITAIGILLDGLLAIDTVFELFIKDNIEMFDSKLKPIFSKKS